MPRTTSPETEEIFWSKVDRSGECWTWTDAPTVYGYGHFWVDGKHKKAHRYSWELASGPIPPGMVVRHKCDNPPCVRPQHLELGTQQDNIVDTVTRGRHPRKIPLDARHQILARLAGGESMRQVGQTYGASKQAIRKFVNER